MSNEKKVFVEVGNARNEEQLRGMEAIKAAGLCPFCPAGLEMVPLNPPVLQGNHWVVTTNRWPFQFTVHHLLAVHLDHAESISDVESLAWVELFKMLAILESKLNLESGALCMRFGDPAGSGASIRHLHAHLIVADPDTDQPGYEERVWFAVGPDPKKREAPVS